MPTLTYRLGNLLAYGSTNAQPGYSGDISFPGLDYTEYGYVCDTPDKLDQAFRTILRVKRWNIHAEYTIETGTINTNTNAFTPTSSVTKQQDVASSTAQMAPGDYAVSEASISNLQYSEWYFGYDGTVRGQSTARFDPIVTWSPINGDVVLAFGGFANLTDSDFGGGAFGGSMDSRANAAEPQDVQIFSFLGTTWWTHLNTAQVTTGDADPTTHIAPGKRATLTAWALTPLEFWPYESTYNPTTGAPA